MNDKEKTNEELKDFPFLRDLKEQEEGFELPFNYFTDLSEEVMNKIHSKSSTHWDWSNWPRYWLEQLMFPHFALKLATLTGVVVTLFVLLLPKNNQTNLVAEKELSSEVIQKYVLANLEEFDTDLFTNLLDETDENQELLEESLPPTELDQMLEEIIDDIDISDLEELL